MARIQIEGGDARTLRRLDSFCESRGLEPINTKLSLTASSIVEEVAKTRTILKAIGEDKQLPRAEKERLADLLGSLSIQLRKHLAVPRTAPELSASRTVGKGFLPKLRGVRLD
jgi:hypothetical protein